MSDKRTIELDDHTVIAISGQLVLLRLLIRDMPGMGEECEEAKDHIDLLHCKLDILNGHPGSGLWKPSQFREIAQHHAASMDNEE